MVYLALDELETPINRKFTKSITFHYSLYWYHTSWIPRPQKGKRLNYFARCFVSSAQPYPKTSTAHPHTKFPRSATGVEPRPHPKNMSLGPLH
jgi:hypothetical protein